MLALPHGCWNLFSLLLWDFGGLGVTAVINVALQIYRVFVVDRVVQGILDSLQQRFLFKEIQSNHSRTPLQCKCKPGLATNSFSIFPFSDKSLICLEVKSMTPHWGNTFLFHSSQQLPRLRLGPSKGFLSWHGALLGPSTRLVRCFRNYRDTRTQSGVSR